MDHGLGVSNWVPPASLLAGSKANPPFQRVSDQPHALPSVTGAWHRAAEHDRHWLTDLELQQRSCMSVPTRYNLHSWDWVALLARLGKDCSIHTAARRDAHISECVPCGRKVRRVKEESQSEIRKSFEMNENEAACQNLWDMAKAALRM